MKRTLPTLFSREVRAIHCVGVAGMGLGPLAIYLADLGFEVSGEDDSMVDAMRVQLVRAGVTLTAVGEVPVACELVVCSSAIAGKHPAQIAASARGLMVVRRGELLAEVVRDRKLVAVCGSHGKTTTTAMIITALRQANFPAGYILGGLFNDETVSPASAGKNDWVIAEIDESDGTISGFAPAVTLAVNLDWDHPDFYRTQSDLERTFAALFSRTKQAVLFNAACPLSVNVAAVPGGTATRMSFGTAGIYSIRAFDAQQDKLQLSLGGDYSIASATVRALGAFNATNAGAALAVAQVIGATLTSELLANYPGVRRRQAVLLSNEELTVIEDYAHHPAEIKALLTSLRVGRERVLAVFQPHRYSRTAQFCGEFAAALTNADLVYLIDVYPAGEAALPGGTTADVYAALRAQAPKQAVAYAPGRTSDLLNRLSREVRRGDLVVFIGAGDIEQSARVWLANLVGAQAEAKRWDAHAEAFRAVMSEAAKVRREESLAEKTTLRVGGAARVYAEPASEADLRALLVEAGERGVVVHMLGRGSNLLVPDEGVEGLVIALSQSTWQTFEVRADGLVQVGAGLRLKNLCGLAAKSGLVGFEFLEGIPGNIGGALRMNAGAMGGWMFDVVDEVRMVTRAGEIVTQKKAEMHVDYRHCEELHEAIAIGACLRPAAQSASAQISSQIDAYREKRQKTQPREPSAGCIFKNPTGDAAGRLIDVSGLKGERVGDAEVSTVHANFIVNRGEATSSDVLTLVRRVRARVRQATGVTLEPEVILYGRDWKEFL